MRRHLYLQIYLAVLASLLLAVAAVGTIWHFAFENGDATPAAEMASRAAAAALPAADAPDEAQREALERLSARLNADFALYDSQRALLASSIQSGEGPLPQPDSSLHGWLRHARSLQLADGRWLVVRIAPEAYPHRFAWIG